jgi:hypothetical protein
MTSPQLTTTNRRAVSRRPPKRTTRATCRKGSLGLGSNLAVEVDNISETGARLVLATPLEKGKEIEMTLHGPARTQIVTLMARVVWCIDNANGTYTVGARFHKRMDYREFLAMVSQGA